MVGREAPFRPFSGREAPISLNFSNWHPFFEFFFNPLFRKNSYAQPIFGLVWQMGENSILEIQRLKEGKDEQVVGRQIVPI
jgi:hypothetical protein